MTRKVTERDPPGTPPQLHAVGHAPCIREFPNALVAAVDAHQQAGATRTARSVDKVMARLLPHQGWRAPDWTNLYEVSYADDSSWYVQAMATVGVDCLALHEKYVDEAGGVHW